MAEWNKSRGAFVLIIDMDTYLNALRSRLASRFHAGLGIVLQAATVALVIASLVVAPEHATAQVQVEAMPNQAPSGVANTEGFIYGTVETRRGTYTGRMRWGREEAFWDDHLNGNRNQRPYLKVIPTEHRGERRPVEVFGVRFGSRFQAWSADRSIVVRYGDIRSIERRGRRHILTMKSGTEVELRGGSNDLGGTLWVWDAERGEVELDFRAVDRIEFMATPADLDVSMRRMHGRVETADGDFEGFVIWDNEERLSTDILDGDDEDGERHKIPLGEIRSIERRSSSSVTVTLEDGRTLILDGTNDVNSSNDGIFVEDPRFGRVEVSWKAFERLDFAPRPSSGDAFTSFSDARPLRGTVETRDGGKLSGGIVYDVDESETWDFLNGRSGGLRHNIPFGLIRAIERIDAESSRVILADGTALELDDSTDVGGRHAGIVVLLGDQPRYVPWAEVRAVTFE